MTNRVQVRRSTQPGQEEGARNNSVVVGGVVARLRTVRKERLTFPMRRHRHVEGIPVEEERARC